MSWWSRLFAPRAGRPAPAVDGARLQRELSEIKAALGQVTAELQQLRQSSERRTLHIDRVEQMTVEQLFHIIGRLEVDELEGTLNVGISRNLRVEPRLPPGARTGAKQKSPTSPK